MSEPCCICLGLNCAPVADYRLTCHLTRFAGPPSRLPLPAAPPLLSAPLLSAGTRSAFTPDVLVNATSSSLVATLLEAIALKAGLYIVSAPEGASMVSDFRWALF